MALEKLQVFSNDFNCGLKAYKNCVKNGGFWNASLYPFSKMRIEKMEKNCTEGSMVTKLGWIVHQWILDLIRFGFVWLEKTDHCWRFRFFDVHYWIFLGFIGFMKLYKLYHDLPYDLVTNNPWFYISLTTMIIGTQLFLAGFLGEIILRTKNNEERYKISTEVNFK